MISLSGCVAELRVGGVKRSALARAFQLLEHQRTLDFVGRIKSYDHLKLLV